VTLFKILEDDDELKEICRRKAEIRAAKQEGQGA